MGRKKDIFYEITRTLMRMMPMGRTANDILVLVTKVNSSQRDLDRQVEEAVEALSTSTDLISNLESSLEERAKRLKELKEEYQRVSNLAELTKEQGDAVAKTLEQTLGQGQSRERWITFVISLFSGLIIFVLGVFLSDWIQELPGKLGFEGSEVRRGVETVITDIAD